MSFECACCRRSEVSYIMLKRGGILSWRKRVDRKVNRLQIRNVRHLVDIILTPVADGPAKTSFDFLQMNPPEIEEMTKQCPYSMSG
jgi:hypothetical protein